ncbi:MAG: hypothetical protein WCV99_16005 [Sterolibacterium sp.]
MATPTYDDVVALFKKGAVAEAEAQFTALHGIAVQRQREISQRRQRAHPSGREAVTKVQPLSDGIAYYCVDNGKRRGPFCRHCYDTASTLEKLRPVDGATYICVACKTECARNLCG